MRIVLDAMGGDRAPRSLVEGALLARTRCPAEIVLAGDESTLRPLFADLLKSRPEAAVSGGVSIVHAPEVVGMDEAGPAALRKKKASSLAVAMGLLAAGEADAVVSAGNSAAVVAHAKHHLGLVPGLRRPVLAVVIPTLRGNALLLDAGAHVEAKGIHLAQSAVLADAYLRLKDGLTRPRIALLNIGEEASKGPKVVRGAYGLLERTTLHFIGNVEAHQVLEGTTDAVVCDGFSGNNLLKFLEGVAEFLRRSAAIEPCLEPASGGSPSSNPWKEWAERMAARELGGAPLLGVLKPVVIAHGRSEAPSIANAVGEAFLSASSDLFRRMAEDCEQSRILSELKHQHAVYALERLKQTWRFGQKS
ncbi:phosphate acyltransferase PlsX [Desulfoglaeba alkanexedens]|uniref:Phosphate acyltransferase n=1 Tax=Desulfoglaeba alkanexedens ALDC TaxID=980445 RepID=A0A4P8L3T6_9BACT|nr:phosphate acyltransferase PlsX [Desulfoglaeba alkanexedens]QCQ22626.1 phosphate acyltransferase PlsX [Desulfoglaeba alkanexedens ALDC]